MGGMHGPMASAIARAYKGGLVKGQSPWSGGKLKHFWFWMFKESCKFAHFSEIWKRKEIKYLCYFLQKFMGGHDMGKRAGWSKTGGLCPPPGSGLKTPLVKNTQYLSF